LGGAADKTGIYSIGYRPSVERLWQMAMPAKLKFFFGEMQKALT
jgi:hypothetical protein